MLTNADKFQHYASGSCTNVERSFAADLHAGRSPKIASAVVSDIDPTLRTATARASGGQEYIKC